MLLIITNFMAKLKKSKRLYRRTDRTDTWHFHRSCSNLPKKNYIEKRRISDGEICDQCLAKEKTDKKSGRTF